MAGKIIHESTKSKISYNYDTWQKGKYNYTAYHSKKKCFSGAEFVWPKLDTTRFAFWQRADSSLPPIFCRARFTTEVFIFHFLQNSLKHCEKEHVCFLPWTLSKQPKTTRVICRFPFFFFAQKSTHQRNSSQLPPSLISPKAKKILAFFHQKDLFFSIGKKGRRVNCPLNYFSKILIGRGGQLTRISLILSLKCAKMTSKSKQWYRIKK